MGLKVREVFCENYGKCVYISNDIVETYVSIDNGINIIYFGLIGKNNVLFGEKKITLINNREKNDISNLIKNINDKSYIGHSFALNMEDNEQFKFNEGRAVYFMTDNGVKFIPESKDYDKIEAFIEIIMGQNTDNMMIVHGVKNLTNISLDAALRSVTDLNGGGILIIPQNIGGQLDTPNRAISFWPYSKIRDKRLFIGNKYITFTHDKNANEPFRFGVNNKWGFALYSNEDMVFLKRYIHNEDAKYLNFGSSLESFSNDKFLSIETVSPVFKIAKNEVARHVENWAVFNVSKNIFDREKLLLDQGKKELNKPFLNTSNEAHRYEAKIDEFVNKV